MRWLFWNGNVGNITNVTWYYLWKYSYWISNIEWIILIHSMSGFFLFLYTQSVYRSFPCVDLFLGLLFGCHCCYWVSIFLVASIISFNKCDLIEIITFDTLVPALFEQQSYVNQKTICAKQEKMNLDPAQQKTTKKQKL